MRSAFHPLLGLSLALILAVAGCSGTPQDQADLAHKQYVVALTALDQAVTAHKLSRAQELTVRNELIPAADLALSVIDARAQAGDQAGIGSALSSLYLILGKINAALIAAPPTTQPR